MGFTVKGNTDSVELQLVSDGEGGVDLMTADSEYVILSIQEDGTLRVHDGIKKGAIGNLKMTGLEDIGWGGDDEYGRPAVFFNNEELVLPSEVKADEPKTKRSKSKAFEL